MIYIRFYQPFFAIKPTIAQRPYSINIFPAPKAFPTGVVIS